MKSQLSTPEDELAQIVYREQVAPVLPPRILDFHTHIWDAANWRERPWEADKAGGRYMVVEPYYPPDSLLRDGRATFPDRIYEAVCFGFPTTPAVDNGVKFSYQISVHKWP